MIKQICPPGERTKHWVLDGQHAQDKRMQGNPDHDHYSFNEGINLPARQFIAYGSIRLEYTLFTNFDPVTKMLSFATAQEDPGRGR